MPRAAAKQLKSQKSWLTKEEEAQVRDFLDIAETALRRALGIALSIDGEEQMSGTDIRIALYRTGNARRRLAP